MIRIVLIDAVTSLGQGRIVVSGRENFDGLVEEKEKTKATGPSVHRLFGARVWTVEIQSQFGGHTIVPNSIVILRQLTVKK